MAKRTLQEIQERADQTLNEVNQEIEKIKQNMKNEKKLRKKPVTIDFDTIEYPAESPFGKYIFAIPLLAEHLNKLKAKCLLNDVDVVEYLSELIAADVEESFSINPEEFNETTYQSATELLANMLDEKIEPLINTENFPLIAPPSKTKIENLTINLNIGGESPKKDDSGSILAGLAGLLMGFLGDAKEKETAENEIKKAIAEDEVAKMIKEVKRTSGTPVSTGYKPID